MLETLLNCDSCCYCTATNMPDPPTIYLRQGLLAWDLAPALNKKLGLEPQGCEQADVCVLCFSVSLCILCDLRNVTLTLEGFRFCHFLCWV
jgi:hypothetical protein